MAATTRSAASESSVSRKRKAKGNEEEEDDDEKMWGVGGGNNNNNSSRKKSKGKDNKHNKGGGVSESNVDKMFRELADTAVDDDDDGSVITMEGICILAEKILGIDPMADVRILVLLYKMGITSNTITQEQWKAGCSKLQVDSAAKFKAHLPSLDLGFLDNEDFKDFFKVSVCVCVLHVLADSSLLYPVLTICCLLFCILYSFVFTLIVRVLIVRWIKNWWWSCGASCCPLALPRSVSRRFVPF